MIYLEPTLERTGGNVKKTAEILNYYRPTLYRKMKKFGLRAERDTEEEEEEAVAQSAAF